MEIKELIASLTPMEREALQDELLKTARGVMYGTIEWEIRDKDGTLIRSGEQRSRSFVANLLRWLRRTGITVGIIGSNNTEAWAGFSATEPVDTGGNARGVLVGKANGAVQVTSCVCKLDGGSGDVNSGLRVGRGVTPPTPIDPTLAIPCTEGTGENQFNHGTTTIDAILIAGSDVSFKIIRVMSNNSAGTIIVSECGIFAQWCYTATTSASFMLARDLISPALSVPTGYTLTLRYILKTTV